jgi:hypothetical protein
MVLRYELQSSRSSGYAVTVAYLDSDEAILISSLLRLPSGPL